MDVFDLMAKIGVDTDEYDKGLEDAGTRGSNIASKIGAGIKAGVAVGTAALGAAATGVAAITKQAVAAYSEQEQLEGGIRKLFGESTDQMLAYADQAYATAGMSANQYMQGVMGFSAALIQAAGRGEQQDVEALKDALDQELKATKEALQAQYNETKKSWTDRIAEAKKGGAKNLDELKAQRDAELAELKKANEQKLAATKDLNKKTVEEAERANMQSTTTTESLKEAAAAADMVMQDISDNVNTFGKFTKDEITGVYQALARGQYQTLDNLMLGYGGTKAELERLVNDANDLLVAQGKAGDLTKDSFIDVATAIHLVQQEMGITGTTANEAAGTMQGSAGAVKAAWENLLAGLADPDADLGQLMENLVSSAIQSLDNFLPAIERSMQGISTALVTQAPQLINTFVDTFSTLGPELIDAATQLVLAITETISTPENIEKIVQTAVDMVLSLADGLTQTLPVLIPAVVQAIVTIAETLTKPENLESLITAAVGIILALVDGITSAIPILVKSIPVIIKNILEALTDPNTLSTIVSGIVSAVTTILESLPEIISILVQAIPEIIAALITAILDPNVLASLISGAVQLVSGLVQAIPQIIVALIAAAPQIIIAFVKALTEPENIRSLIEGAITLVVELVKAMPEIILALIQAIPDIIVAIIDAFSSLPGELKGVFENGLKLIKEVLTPENFKKWGKDLMDGLVGGIKSKYEDLKSAARGAAEKISSFLHFSEPDEGPLANFHTFAPDMMKLFAQGIKDNTDMIQDQMNTAFALPNVEGTYANSGAVKTGSNTITINVYGAEGQDEERLAEIVGDRLMHELNMERMVYA